MKKAKLATILIYCLLIPATLFLSTKLPGRSYYISGTLLMLELMIPFFLSFEGRKPQARELVVTAVMCAIAIVGRVAIPLPHFKATFAVVMLTGMVFGGQTGFVVGAISALASNFFYGQGAYTPWQMVAYGLAGLLAGIFFRSKIFPKEPWAMAAFGFFAVLFVVGPVMDCAGIFMVVSRLTLRSVITTLASGLIYANLSLAASTALCMLLFGRFFLEKLERVTRKYGMFEVSKK